MSSRNVDADCNAASLTAVNQPQKHIKSIADRNHFCIRTNPHRSIYMNIIYDVFRYERYKTQTDFAKKYQHNNNWRTSYIYSTSRFWPKSQAAQLLRLMLRGLCFCGWMLLVRISDADRPLFGASRGVDAIYKIRQEHCTLPLISSGSNQREVHIHLDVVCIYNGALIHGD